MKTVKYVFASVMAMALLMNCGGEKKKEEEPSNQLKIKAAETTKADENVANIVITGNDMMQFNLKEIKVKAGQKVKLTLRHIGKLDKKNMGHNVVILKKGVDMVEFAINKAASNAANDYIPEDTKDIIAYTKLIGGGETTTIEFDAPPAGEYTFLCSFPGHYGMMNGKFIVE